MKLLFDQNLSRKLVNRMADIFPDASHVQFHALTDADDRDFFGSAIAMSVVGDRYLSNHHIAMISNG